MVRSSASVREVNGPKASDDEFSASPPPHPTIYPPPLLPPFPTPVFAYNIAFFHPTQSCYPPPPSPFPLSFPEAHAAAFDFSQSALNPVLCVCVRACVCVCVREREREQSQQPTEAPLRVLRDIHIIRTFRTAI